jgi:carbon storage regulator
MLVLTRKAGQKIIIGQDIEIVVLEARGDTVKIGIQAPKSVSVLREELYQEIRRANQQAPQQLPVAPEALQEITRQFAGKPSPIVIKRSAPKPLSRKPGQE